MLLIVMHKKREYLDYLLSIMKKKKMGDPAIIQKEGIGSIMFGDRESAIRHFGGFSKEYNHALVSIVNGNEVTDYLMELMKNDPELKFANFEERGFICTVPFDQIKSLELKLISIKKGEYPMNIIDYLAHENILLDLKAQNKEDAIKEIAVLLKNKPEVINYDIFLQDVFEREKLASTGIGNEVALPHARTDVVEDFVIAFGRSKKGIEFDSIDGKKAKLIFVMGTPQKKGLKLYLRILAHINRLLKKEAFRASLMDASNFKDIINTFSHIEKDVSYALK